MVDMALIEQVVGAVGVLTTNGLALTLLKPVFEARREGSLAGLDARLWPLNFMNQMLWTGYSIAVGDVWLFFSALPAAVMWLFFCLTIVELLSQEEGELTPVSPRTHLQKQELFKRSTAANFEELDDLHGLSKMHRVALIQKTELFVCGGLLFSGLVSFALIPERFLGFPMLSGLLPEETRIAAFGFVCMVVSIACYVEPVKKVRGVWKSRDASSVFLPNVFGGLANVGVWLSYGVMTGNPGLIIPLAIGLLNCSALLVLRLVFGSGTQVEDETDSSKTGARSGDVLGIQEAWGAICPSPVTQRGPPPQFGHKRLVSTSSNASLVSSAVSARSNTKLIAGSARSSTTGHANDNDIANLEDLESPYASELVESALQSETSHERASSSGLPSQANELPDLSGRLKEMGVYEDYLKWQRDYQKWRKGGAKGAKGECQVEVPGAASSSGIRIDEGIEEESA